MMKTRTFSRLLTLLLALALLTPGGASPARSAPQDTFPTYLPVIEKGFISGPATVTGIVRDAATGEPLDNADVCYGTQCDNTDDTGRYVLTNVGAGYRKFAVTSAGYSPIVESFWVIGMQTNERNYALNSGLIIGGIYMRMVTTWPANTHWPASDCGGGVLCENDLDGLLWLELIGETTVITTIDPYHQGDCTTYPNSCHEYDARQGSGPETLAILKLNFDTHYYFGVLNVYQGYPGVPPMAQSGAISHIYDIAGLDVTLNAPNEPGELWYIFHIDSVNAFTPTLTFMNCMTYLPNETNPVPECPAGTQTGPTYILPPEAFGIESQP